MDHLATRSGFSTCTMFDGRVRWQTGTLTGEANDSIGALMMALHWLVGEIRDLQSQLDQLQENTMSTPMFRPAPHQQEHDIALQLQDAEQRRACDQFLRQSPVRSTWIANDAAVLLNAILDQAPANTAVEVSTAGQGAGVQESMCDITGGQRAKSASPAGVTRQKRKEAMLN